MFDDSPSLLPSQDHQGYKVPVYPTKQINTPIAIFHGGQDTIPDVDYIINRIQKPVFCLKIKGIFR
jgi:lysosomal acid lipase/cholesteryl ester hydrolase